MCPLKIELKPQQNIDLIYQNIKYKFVRIFAVNVNRY